MSFPLWVLLDRTIIIVGLLVFPMNMRLTTPFVLQAKRNTSRMRGGCSPLPLRTLSFQWLHPSERPCRHIPRPPHVHPLCVPIYWALLHRWVGERGKGIKWQKCALKFQCDLRENHGFILVHQVSVYITLALPWSWRGIQAQWTWFTTVNSNSIKW